MEELSPQEFQAKLIETQTQLVRRIIYVARFAKYYSVDVFDTDDEAASFIENVLDLILQNIKRGTPLINIKEDEIEVDNISPFLSQSEKIRFLYQIGAFTQEKKKELFRLFKKYQSVLVAMKEYNIQPILFSKEDLLALISSFQSTSSSSSSSTSSSSSSSSFSNASPMFNPQSSSSSSSSSSSTNASSSSSSSVPTTSSSSTVTLDSSRVAAMRFQKSLRQGAPKKARMEEYQSTQMFLPYPNAPFASVQQRLNNEEYFRQALEVVQLNEYARELARTQYLSKAFKTNILENITGYRSEREIDAYLRTNPSEDSIARNIFSRRNYDIQKLFRIYKYCIRKGYLRAIQFIFINYPEVWDYNPPAERRIVSNYRFYVQEGGKGNFVFMGLEETVVGGSKNIILDKTKQLLDLIMKNKNFKGFPPVDSLEILNRLGRENLYLYKYEDNEELSKQLNNLILIVLENTIQTPNFQTSLRFSDIMHQVLESDQPEKVKLFFTLFNARRNVNYDDYIIFQIYLHPTTADILDSLGIYPDLTTLNFAISSNSWSMAERIFDRYNMQPDVTVFSKFYRSNRYDQELLEDEEIQFFKKVYARYTGPFPRNLYDYILYYPDDFIIQVLQDPRSAVFTLNDYDNLSLKLFNANKLVALKEFVKIMKEKFSKEEISSTQNLSKFVSLLNL